MNTYKAVFTYTVTYETEVLAYGVIDAESKLQDTLEDVGTKFYTFPVLNFVKEVYKVKSAKLKES